MYIGLWSKMQESNDSFEMVPDYFTCKSSWFCHVTSATENTQSVQFHEKVPSQNKTQRYLFLSQREKLLLGACLPCSLWTSLVQQSPLLSILMPTSNCENQSCFRRKSIPCVDQLPFGCIMFFAMKGSYEPENVFVGCFLMANSFCPPCSQKYNIALKHPVKHPLGIVSKPPTFQQFAYFHIMCENFWGQDKKITLFAM